MLVEPAIATGVVTLLTLIINGVFAHIRDRRRDRIETSRYAERVAVEEVLVSKIDENTQENREQIKVSNHVNEKLILTTEVAEKANTLAADSMGEVKREIADLRTELCSFATSAADLRAMVKSNTACIAILLERTAKAD